MSCPRTETRDRTHSGKSGLNDPRIISQARSVDACPQRARNLTHKQYDSMMQDDFSTSRFVSAIDGLRQKERTVPVSRCRPCSMFSNVQEIVLIVLGNPPGTELHNLDLRSRGTRRLHCSGTSCARVERIRRRTKHPRTGGHTCPSARDR